MSPAVNEVRADTGSASKLVDASYTARDVASGGDQGERGRGRGTRTHGAMHPLLFRNGV